MQMDWKQWHLENLSRVLEMRGFQTFRFQHGPADGVRLEVEVDACEPEAQVVDALRAELERHAGGNVALLFNGGGVTTRVLTATDLPLLTE